MTRATRDGQNSIRCVLFDFDFTLVDSSVGAHECTAHALRELGLNVVGSDRIQATIGMSLHRAFRTLTNQDSTDMADEFCRIFIEHAEQVMADLTHVYPATRPMAVELKRRGLLLGIVSNKYRCGVEEVLGRNDLDNAFDVIVGGDEVEEPKPSPEGILKAAARLGVTANNVLYVGDSVIDAEAAHRASMSFAAVLTGTTNRGDFDPFLPLAILSDLGDLIVRLDEFA